MCAIEVIPPTLDKLIESAPFFTVDTERPSLRNLRYDERREPGDNLLPGDFREEIFVEADSCCPPELAILMKTPFGEAVDSVENGAILRSVHVDGQRG